MKTPQFSLRQLSHHKPFHRKLGQRGDAVVVGIVCMVVLVLFAIGFFLLLNSQKEKPILTVNQPKVSADDSLTSGRSNNELVQDALILTAGNKRDSDQLDAATKTLNDQAQAIDATSTDSTDTTVEQDRLSQLQTAFGSESDRRISNLKDALGMIGQLTKDQQNILEPLLNAEVGTISALKTRAASETATDAFNVDKDNLDKEYVGYLLLISQVKMLAWADDQSILNTKYNTLGGKFQERLNDASGQGASIADSQTVLNNYQAHKTNATAATTKVLKELPTIKAADYNANRAVLKTYLSQLSSAHTELTGALDNAKSLTTAIQQMPTSGN